MFMLSVIVLKFRFHFYWFFFVHEFGPFISLYSSPKDSIYLVASYFFRILVRLDKFRVSSIILRHMCGVSVGMVWFGGVALRVVLGGGFFFRFVLWRTFLCGL